MFFVFLIIALYLLSKLDEKSFLFILAFFGINALSLYIADVFGLNGVFMFGIIVLSSALTFIGNGNFIGNEAVSKKYYLVSFVFNMPLAIFAYYKFIELMLGANTSENDFSYILKIDSYLVNLIANANFYNVYLTVFIFMLIGALPNAIMKNHIRNQ